MPFVLIRSSSGFLAWVFYSSPSDCIRTAVVCVLRVGRLLLSLATDHPSFARRRHRHLARTHTLWQHMQTLRDSRRMATGLGWVVVVTVIVVVVVWRPLFGRAAVGWKREEHIHHPEMRSWTHKRMDGGKREREEGGRKEGECECKEISREAAAKEFES